MSASVETDVELFDMMREKLYAAVVCDTLDKLGHRNQAMRADLRPVYDGATVVGRALTVLTADVYEPTEDPYDLEIEAVDSLAPNNVLVAATGRSTRTCFWGELLSTAAQTRGARGTVVDGYVRDVRQIAEMQYPVFAAGLKPVDSLGRSIVVGYECPVECGDVLVSPGDVVFGDVDGIVVVPKDALDELVPLALEKVAGENRTREELLKGAKLREVYDRYGVL